MWRTVITYGTSCSRREYRKSYKIQLGLNVIETGLEPEINIQQFDNREVQEYSVNDRVYMVKITPAVGSPYYLVDPDGTGEMEYKRDTIGLEVNPPQWTLFRW